jgi:hypothetical protein
VRVYVSIPANESLCVLLACPTFAYTIQDYRVKFHDPMVVMINISQLYNYSL